MQRSNASSHKASYVGPWRWLVEEGTVTTVAEVAALYGVPLAGAIPDIPLESFIDAIHPDDVGRFRLDLSSAIGSGSEIDLTYRLIKSDGSVRQVSAVGSCVRFLNGRPAEYLGVVHLTSLADDPVDLVTDHLLSAAQLIRSTDHALLRYLIDMAMLEAGHCLARKLGDKCVPLRQAV